MSDITLAGQAQASTETEQVSVNGVDLFVRTIGTGPDVVMLHGGPSATQRSLLPALDRLATGRRLRYYDQRGCGESRIRADVPLGWQCHVDDLKELLDCWRIEEATIVGHSWGALLALLFAIQNPARTNRMVLVTPAAITAEGRNQFLKRLARRMVDLGIVIQQRDLLESDLRRRDPAAFRQRAFELTLAPHLKNPEQLFDIEHFQITHRVREAVWRSLGDYDITGEISSLSIPTLVVHGRCDPIPLSSSEQIALLLGARLEIFEDSGHMPFFEECDRFAEVVDGFLPRIDEQDQICSAAITED